MKQNKYVKVSNYGLKTKKNLKFLTKEKKKNMPHLIILQFFFVVLLILLHICFFFLNNKYTLRSN